MTGRAGEGQGDPERALAALAGRLRTEDLRPLGPPPPGARRAAVLILFGPVPGDPAPRPETLQLLLIERAAGLRAHPGQIAFPGGAIDPGDAGAEAAALREAAEETGLDRSGVRVLGTLPEVFLPVSGYSITPVLGWWHRRSPVAVADPVEVAKVLLPSVADLVDPSHRCEVTRGGGHVGPGFCVDGLVIWGFTALLLDRVLESVGWSRPSRRGGREGVEMVRATRVDEGEPA